MNHDPPLLIGCDLGDTSRTVVSAGLALARLLDAPAMLAHVDDYGHLLGELFHAVDPGRLARMKREYAAEAVQRMTALLGGLGAAGVEVRVLEGRAYERLARLAAETEAIAVVIGCRGRPRALPHPAGRTAIRVVHEAPCPIFSIEVGRPWRKPSRILFATDLGTKETAARRWVGRLAAACRADVSVVHVSEVGPGLAAPYVVPPSILSVHRERLSQRLQRLEDEIASSVGTSSSVESHLVVGARDVATAIREATERQRGDLVVVGTHGRSGIGRAVLGSVAEGVLHDAPATVLVVRDADE